MTLSLINLKIYDMSYRFYYTILNTNKIMINGVTRSSAFQITQSKINHTRKLDQIANAKKTQMNFEIDVQKQMLQSNQRHVRAQSMKRFKINEHIKNQNRKMVMSMSRIAFRHTLYPIQSSHEKKKSNFQFEQQRTKRQIKQQNIHLIEKILIAKSHYQQSKIKADFKQSRQRLKRIQKFDNFRKLTTTMKSIERIMSQPSVKIKKTNSTLRVKTHESENPQIGE